MTAYVVCSELSPDKVHRFRTGQTVYILFKFDTQMPYTLGGMSNNGDLSTSLEEKFMQINQCIENIQQWGVKISEVELVQEYLLEHFLLLPILQSICQTTKVSFVESIQLFLELYIDPEIDNQYLALYIRKSEYEEDILEKIESIRNKYLNPYLKGMEKGWILLTTDFNPLQ